MKLTDRIYWVGSGCVGLSAEGDCHVYAVEGDDAIALIDCGMARDPELILRNLKNDGMDLDKLKYVLLTHAHPDHAGGCLALQKERGLKIVCSDYEGRMLRQGAVDFFKHENTGMVAWMEREMPKCEPDIIVGDDDEIDLGGVKLRVIVTPGHTGGSVCYLTEIGGQQMLFSGDTIFYKGFISVLPAPFSDLTLYKPGLLKLRDLRVDGLFPSHLMFVLKQGQSYIDKANTEFSNSRTPERKPFS
ncbi:MAG: MBL fold metallo-hydrolase [Oscillospiraceae bacterium]|jgi:glyoxylase-like metal-dependent hydrolase (beta-lactamase superfamily II)|nr:MBL fold metallo-hydrolase [Oscillospiraceae bacterium]